MRGLIKTQACRGFHGDVKAGSEDPSPVCCFSTFLAGEGSRSVRGSPASVCRTWMPDKGSIKLIVLEAGSLEWRKQVLGADYPVLKGLCSLFSTF